MQKTKEDSNNDAGFTVEIEDGPLDEVKLDKDNEQEEEEDEMLQAERLQQPCPEVKANIFSKLTYWWFNCMHFLRLCEHDLLN